MLHNSNITELLSDMLNNIHDMIFIIRMDNEYIEYVNQTTIDNYGYTREEMNEVGLDKFRRTIGKDEPFLYHLQELKEKRSVTDYVYIIRKDGTEFPVEVNAKLVQVNGIDYNLAIVRDITERLDLMEKLQNQAIQTQNYLDISKVIIMALDNEKNVIMINQTGADILGYRKEEIIGKNFIENFLPKNIQENLNIVAKSIIEKKDNYSVYENFILTKSGEERLISWKNTALTDENGSPIGILTSGEDITEMRTRERQLLLHTKQAQMGEMIGMIAHQWRQPLAAISATTSLLKLKQSLGGYNEAYFDKQLNNIEEYTQHLSKTIDDFRNFFKENKHQVDTYLSDIINGAIDIVGAIFANRGIELRTNFLSKEKLSTYPNELTQVILNILKNAQEVIEERGIKEPVVEIETYEKEDRFYLTIKDNAGGISDDIIDNIFDPYFTTKGEFNGTGLGLYMSKTIIDEHCKGYIKVKNLEAGALFIICLNKTA